MRTSRLAAPLTALLAVGVLAGCNDTQSPSSTPSPTMSEDGSMTEEPMTEDDSMTEEPMTDDTMKEDTADDNGSMDDGSSMDEDTSMEGDG